MSFTLKKLIAYLILPPGIFILSFLLVYLLSRKKLVRFISLSSALSLYLLSIEPVKDALFYPLESPYWDKKPESADAIVILGGGAYNNGRLKPSSYRRLVAGFLLYRKLRVPLIVSGGASLGSIPEAEEMRELLRAFGVPRDMVFAELRSTDTAQNARFVKEICKKLGCKRVALVTSAFHMKRALSLFRRAGLDAVPAPTDFRFEGRYNLYSLFPKYSVLYDSSTAVREYLALLFYKLKGLL
ncbi:MAG: YdcF family protein [Aquificae bacterium]|nr:YdcF family protein [Aquificota bacterium]